MTIVLALGVGGGLWLRDYLQGEGDRLEPGQRQQVQPNLEIRGDLGEAVESEVVNWRLESVVEGLYVPWSLAFTSEDRVLVSERNGKIREIIADELQTQPLITFPVSETGEEGLMGLVLDPDYAENKFVYACYAYDGENGLVDRVVRLIDEEEGLVEDEVILDEIPAARFHAGCELGFGPDGKLYITTGDATDGNLAQDMSSLAGKILRINPDGSVPADNPFGNSLIFSLGHRNPQGIDWHPSTKQLYSTEHGPSGFDGPGGGDEVNLIIPGANYGWPIVSHDEREEGTEPSLIQFTPAEAPGSMIVYSGQVFGRFANNIFFGALRGEGLVRVELAEDGEAIKTVEKLDISVGRVREVIESPEGYIYFTTSNQDGRGEVREGDDKVYRLVPENL